MDAWLSLLMAVLLLAANAFFVAAEFALVKAKNFRIQALAEQGSGSARLALYIHHNLEAYLAACQLGITMASLGLGWVGEPTVAALLEPVFHSFELPDKVVHSVSFVIGFLLFSSLHIVVGEQVPKTLAIRKAEPVSLAVAYPLHFAYLAVYPLNWALNWASGRILGLFGVAEATHAEVLSGEELKGLVQTSREHGEIAHDKADMLHNLFEFDQRPVGRVMIPLEKAQVLDLAATPEQNLEVIRETGHSRFPVIDSADDDEIKGIVLVKDIHMALLDGEEIPWADLRRFLREPLVIPESQRVSELFDLMRMRRAHMAIVVDEYGQLTGIVTLEDLLEEIVGEIHDETDEDESHHGLIELDDGGYEADGLMSLSDLERVLGVRFGEDIDANTLSGMFMQRLARMPETGDRIEEAGYRLSVMSIEDRRVGKVRIEPVRPQDDAAAFHMPGPEEQ